jgi:hypothetical protein
MNDIFVRYSQRMKSSRCENLVAVRIVLAGFTMNAAIDFDHECGSVAVEVYDKARYLLLSAEVPAV